MIVVDGSLAHRDQLLTALGAQGSVLVLDPNAEPIAQILKAAADLGPLDAIHLLSHGSSGSIQIAGQSYGAEQLASLGGALAPGGDLLLYGCDVAAGTDGRVFVEQLARLSGADVAASTDRTGAGGNWTLEQSSGNVEAQALVAQQWQGDLATTITVTGSKVNEGSTYVPFSITGLSAGQIALLGVVDKTTSGLVDANIKYSFDNGATWIDYGTSITAPAGFTTTSKLLVAVSDSAETLGSIAVEGIERYQLEVNTLPTSISFQTQTKYFLVAGESEPFVKTQVAASSKCVFNFGGPWPNKDSFTQKLVLAGKTIGTVTFPQPAAANEFGGANGSKFVTASDSSPVTINLTTPQSYFGFWWSAGDGGNILEFYKGGELIETFKAELMDDNFPAIQLGNPYAKYINDAGDVGFSKTLVPEDSQANSGEKYAFLNFFMKGGKSFDKIVMRGSNFEFDNLTFLKNLSTVARGDGTIVDDGSGIYLALDANGNPIVDTNGNFVNNPNAFVDNDYDDTPSLNDCWYVRPINLLANDVPSVNTRQLDPTSIKLYSSATSSGTGEGGQTLTTALGEFEVTPTGVLFFNPSASFNGDSDKITIYYTVADSSGNVSLRAAVKLDPTAVNAPTASNGAAPVLTPWVQTNANATELFRFDNGTQVIPTRTVSGSATSVIVDLQTNSDNDDGGTTVYNARNNGGAGGVQARLKLDTTAIGTTTPSQLNMGFSIPSSSYFGDFVDLGNVSVNVDGRRADPYATGDNTLKYWRDELGGTGGVDQTKASNDFYTSQQVDITQDWYDFDPMENAWVKFETGNLTALQGKATATSYEIGTLKVSFQNPSGAGLGANNPLIHLANLGGAYVENSASTRGGGVGAQLELVSAVDANNNAITGASLSKLSGNLGLTGNRITSSSDGATSFGTVKVNGTNVASVTFKVLIKGY